MSLRRKSGNGMSTPAGKGRRLSGKFSPAANKENAAFEVNDDRSGKEAR